MDGFRIIYFAVTLLLLTRVGRGAPTNDLLLHLCEGTSHITANVHSGQNVTVSYYAGIGIVFKLNTPTLANSMTERRGLLILPEEGVAPEAYASYARSIASFQDEYFAVILEKATAGHVVKAMMQYPWTEFWSLAGHGKGGHLAAEIALALQPKVKSLVLIGAALPEHVDLRSVNMFLAVIYFGNDNVVSPKTVNESFSRIPGDATINYFPDLSHYDFIDQECVKKECRWCKDCKTSAGVSHPGENGVGTSVRTCWRVYKERDVSEDSEFFALASDSARKVISTLLVYSLGLVQWPVATEKALSYGDNAHLTTGHNDSKPYPGETRVRFEAVPISGSNPQRMLWVFVPSQVKGGLIYFGGAAVDPRAYWPLAFEIAARGHLVVIPEIPSRNAMTTYADANIILDSNLSLFSGVPKGRWAIGGHSLGSIGATAFAASYGERIYAMVLHSGGWAQNMSECTIPAILLYGTLDSLLGSYDAYRTYYQRYANLAVTTFSPVTGANHGQVGDYGHQPRDQVAVISIEEQHRIFAERSVEFLDRVGAQSLASSVLHSISAWLTMFQLRTFNTFTTLGT